MKRSSIAITLIALSAVSARAEGINDAQSRDRAERDRIAAARQVAEQRLADDEAACHRKFAVNDCLSAARSQRREALADLRRQEVALNDRQRRQAAALRQQRLDEKAAASAAREDSAGVERSVRVRPERADGKARPVRERSTQDRQGPRHAGSEAGQSPDRQRADLSEQRAAKAAERARQARARLQEAQDRQSRAEKRSGGGSHPGSPPLPAPP